jgi:ABC-type glycerol-3-phosphate transport system substrate-binding protein
MKKAILLILALVLTLSLAACGGKDNDSGTLNREDGKTSSTAATATRPAHHRAAQAIPAMFPIWQEQSAARASCPTLIRRPVKR